MLRLLGRRPQAQKLAASIRSWRVVRTQSRAAGTATGGDPTAAAAVLSKKQLGVAQEKLAALTGKWAEEWNELVQWELQADTAVAQQRVKTWGDKRLKAEGHMLEGLGANGVAADTVAFALPHGDGLLPEHRFQNGDTATVCRGNPTDDQWVEGKDRMEGLIVRLAPNALHIKFADEIPNSLFEGVWRLDRGTNGVSAERQRVALDNFVNPAQPDIPCDMWLKAILLDDKELLTELRQDAAKLARAEPQGIATAFKRSPTGELSTDSAMVTQLLDEAKLNESQRNAVTSALAQRLTLIQGPPGTGKTHCSVQLLKLFVASQRENIMKSLQKAKKNRKVKKVAKHIVLATANSNTAADNLLEGLIEQGVKAIRAGPVDKIRPSMQGASMHHLGETHPARKVEQQLEDIVAELSSKIRVIQDAPAAPVASERPQLAKAKGRGRLAQMASAMSFDAGIGVGVAEKTVPELKALLFRAREQLQELRKQIKEDIITSAEVVVATCISSGELADTGLFKVVLIDEASQSTVPTCLVPISKGCRQLVLVGDSNQLPPTVKTDRAMTGGLNRSLFERLQDMGIASIMLNTQYRMHPAIAKFPSEQFYLGELKNAENVLSLQPPFGFDWPIRDGEKVPVAFVPQTDGLEQVSLDGNSKSNLEEASSVVRALRQLLMPGDLVAADIGLVTPYKGQVELLNKMLAAEDLFAGVEVNSVDGYQGREKEVILFSAVRSNPDGRVGFLADWRRLNVAMTRAKRGLLVFGNPGTLKSNEVWAGLLGHIEAHGALPADSFAASVLADEEEGLSRAMAHDFDSEVFDSLEEGAGLKSAMQ